MSPIKKVLLLLLGVLFLMFLPNNLGLILHSKEASMSLGEVVGFEYVSGSPRQVNRLIVKIKDFAGMNYKSYLYNRKFEISNGDSLTYRILYNGGGVRILKVNNITIQTYYEWWDFMSIFSYLIIAMVLIYFGVQKAHRYRELRKLKGIDYRKFR